MKLLLGITLFIVMMTASVLFLLGENQSVKKHPVVSSEKDFWLENDDILLYLEAIIQIKNNDLYVNPETKRREIVQDTLRSYVEQTDPFAAYMSAAEFAAWKKSQGDQYVGIGMEIVKDPDGQVICLPYAGSPAEMAGIRSGDRLIGIDGEPVQGRSILAISSMARGGPDSSVKLLIMTRMGEQQNISVKRSHVSFDSITVSPIDDIPVIKIAAFTRETKAKLEKALVEIDKNNPVVIDLRANAGGDLSTAIDSATLFLDKNKNIVSIKTRQTTEKYESSNKSAYSDSPRLLLWQDEGTASAAEVFIAALTGNLRAVSIGRKSFGKGSKQEIIELSDGSALFITSGFLQSPDGLFFDGVGLNPDYPIESKNPQVKDYLLKVKELLTKEAI